MISGIKVRNSNCLIELCLIFDNREAKFYAVEILHYLPSIFQALASAIRQKLQYYIL